MTRFICLILLFMAACFPARAEETLDYHTFKRLPVQHEGRIKPVDTFARSLLDAFANSDSLEGFNAEAWLAETLFDPASAANRPVFHLYRPALFGLAAHESRLYSYADIAAALRPFSDRIDSIAAREEKTWDEDERELMRISGLSLLYGQLLRSFSFDMPLGIAIPEPLAKAWAIASEEPVTFSAIAPHRIDLKNRMEKIVKRKGGDPARYTSEEKSFAEFAFAIATVEQGGAETRILRVIPDSKPEAKGEWRTPWMARGDAPEAFSAWRAIAAAYRNGDAANFTKAGDDALSAVSGVLSVEKTNLELFYNETRPLDVATGLYVLAFLSVVVLSLKSGKRARLAALAFTAAGALSHTAAIVLRVVILSRPPVGTLYESILFVALACVLIALLYEAIKRDGTGLLIAPVAGLILLFCARGFADEDSMQVLVAVLNTNFWLATHVLCITMGYAWCVIASLAAHVWLFRRMRGQEAAALAAPVKTLSLIALFFTAFGTILGGIWADQSWGRFWGWDPKENGALLIVLWLIWLLHGRIGGQISHLLFMAGTAMLSVVVALAWFGVNLLGTGLHSYGFITGVASALGAFCAIETALIGFCVLRIGRTKAPI